MSGEFFHMFCSVECRACRVSRDVFAFCCLVLSLLVAQLPHSVHGCHSRNLELTPVIHLCSRTFVVRCFCVYRCLILRCMSLGYGVRITPPCYRGTTSMKGGRAQLDNWCVFMLLHFWSGVWSFRYLATVWQDTFEGESRIIAVDQ